MSIHNMLKNLDINEFQLKSNNDMMRCVICNKSSIYTKAKSMWKTEKKQITLWNEFF